MGSLVTPGFIGRGSRRRLQRGHTGCRARPADRFRYDTGALVRSAPDGLPGWHSPIVRVRVPCLPTAGVPETLPDRPFPLASLVSSKTYNFAKTPRTDFSPVAFLYNFFD